MPGAWITLDGKQTRVFGSKMWHGAKPKGAEVSIEGSAAPGIVHSEGLLISGSDGRHINVKLLNVEGKFVQVRGNRLKLITVGFNCCAYFVPTAKLCFALT